MNNSLCLLTSYVLNTLWIVAAVGGMGWAVSRLLRRLGPEIEHRVWVATLAMAVLTSLAPCSRFLVSMTEVPKASGTVGSSISPTMQTGQPLASYGIVHLSPSWMLVLSILYLGSLLYFVMRFIWIVRQTSKLLKDATAVVLGAQSDLVWSNCKRQFSIENAVMLESQQISGPVTISLVRPVLLVPPSLIDVCSLEDLGAAWGHECAHMKRRDFQKNLLYEIASLFIAFHPVTRLIRSRIAQTREMVCDGMVTDRMANSTLYARSLLRLATLISGPSRVTLSNAIGIFDANILERRIMMIYARKKPVSSTLKYGLILPGSLLMFSIAAVGSNANLSVQAKTSDTAEATASASTAAGKAVPKGHACTYIKTIPTMQLFPGTCVMKKHDTDHFYCAANQDKSLVQEQIACGVGGKLYLAH